MSSQTAMLTVACQKVKGVADVCKFHMSIGQFLHSMFGGLVSKPHSRHPVSYEGSQNVR